MRSSYIRLVEPKDRLGFKAKLVEHYRRVKACLRKGSIHQLFSSPRQSRRDSLLDLPADILYLIFPHLPLLSQVCLALSCKSLYSLFGNVLKHESLRWPRMTRAAELPLNQPHLPRNQLLLMLEDDRWLYCSGCLKLHPRSRFWRPPADSLKRRCALNTGVVDLCPCITITLYDRVRLEESLIKGQMDSSLPVPIKNAFHLTLSKDRDHHQLIHKCTITYHAIVYITLRITLTRTLNPSKDAYGLTGTTRYNIYSSTPHAVDGSEKHARYFDMEPFFHCPHFDVLHWLCRNKATIRLPMGIGCFCHASSILVEGTADGLFSAVSCRRHLGRIPPAKDLWQKAGWKWKSNVRKNSRTSIRGVFYGIARAAGIVESG